MTTYRMNLNTIDKVQRFARIISMQQGQYEFVTPNSTVNAKSVLGIFSLDLMRPLELRTEADRLPNELKTFLD